MRFLLITLPLIFLLISSQLMADSQSAVGWHWYNETAPLEKNKNNKKNDANKLYETFENLTPSEKLKILQQATTELRDKAVLSGNVNDIANYKRAQDMWVKKATKFTVGWQRMLLENPNLNYSLQYSHENALAPVMQQHQHELQNSAISKLAKNNGLLVFYRADRKSDLMFVKVVTEFSKSHHIPLILVSEGSKNIGNLADFQNVENRYDPDYQRAHPLRVDYFPAVLLVNPKTGTYQIVSYGYKSEDEMSSRLLSIYDNWKPNF